MDSLFNNFPKIIREASKTLLGVLSLIIILLFGVAYGLFFKEDGILKVIVFAMLFLGAILFGISIYKTAEKKKEKTIRKDSEK